MSRALKESLTMAGSWLCQLPSKRMVQPSRAVPRGMVVRAAIAWASRSSFRVPCGSSSRCVKIETVASMSMSTRVAMPLWPPLSDAETMIAAVPRGASPSTSSLPRIWDWGRSEMAAWRMETMASRTCAAGVGVTDGWLDGVSWLI